MSAEIIPMPAPPPVPSNVTAMPAPPAAAPEDLLTKLRKNPLLLAGGALLAGAALTRLFATPSVRKLAQDLAEEAMKRARQSNGETPEPASLLEQGVAALRPQVTEAAKSFLAAILKKP